MDVLRKAQMDSPDRVLKVWRPTGQDRSKVRLAIGQGGRTPVRECARTIPHAPVWLIFISAFLLASFSAAYAQSVSTLTVNIVQAPSTFTLSVLPPYVSDTQPLAIAVVWDVNKAKRLQVWADFTSTTAFRSLSNPTYTIAADAVEAQSVSGCSTCSTGWTAFGNVTDVGRQVGTPGAAFLIDSRSVTGNPRDSGSVREILNLRVNLSKYYNTVEPANDYEGLLTIHVQVF